MFEHKLALTVALFSILLVADGNRGVSGTAYALEVGTATVDIRLHTIVGNLRSFPER